MLVENFICNEPYIKRYPVPDWETMEFFQLRGNKTEFRERGDNPAESEYWTNCNLLNSKSVSDKNKGLK